MISVRISSITHKESKVTPSFQLKQKNYKPQSIEILVTNQKKLDKQHSTRVSFRLMTGLLPVAVCLPIESIACNNKKPFILSIQKNIKFAKRKKKQKTRKINNLNFVKMRENLPSDLFLSSLLVEPLFLVLFFFVVVVVFVHQFTSFSQLQIVSST